MFKFISIPYNIKCPHLSNQTWPKGGFPDQTINFISICIVLLWSNKENLNLNLTYIQSQSSPYRGP